MLSVGALVLFGHLFHLEFWFNIVHMLLLSAALCLSDSVKPLAVSNLIFIFQVTLKHSPSAPHFSTYYFEGANLWIVAALVVILLAALISYLVRTEFFSHVRFGKTPLLLPLVLFSATLLTNGLFFDRYTVSNLTFAAVQVAVYLVDFLVLWDGLRRIEPAELIAAEHHEIRFRMGHKCLDPRRQFGIEIRLSVEIGNHQDAEMSVRMKPQNRLFVCLCIVIGHIVCRTSRDLFFYSIPHKCEYFMNLHKFSEILANSSFICYNHNIRKSIFSIQFKVF
jgi:hypothetical protein